MGKQLFEKPGNACKLPYKKQCQMEENHSKIGKRPPKSLKKHYLEKVFASRSRQVEKPYKTNRKHLFEKSVNASQSCQYDARSGFVLLSCAIVNAKPQNVIIATAPSS